jgi:hypothetical protein
MTFAEINALPVPEWKRVFLRTLVKYGAIVMDTGSDFFFTWQTESGSQYTAMGVPDAWWQFGSNMYAQQVADWEMNPDGNYVGTFHDYDDGLDWDAQVWSKLRLLDPCVSTAACR